MISKTLTKYKGNSHNDIIISEGDSCDVSVSVCEDSAQIEETGIANKIRCVNVHNNSVYKLGPP